MTSLGDSDDEPSLGAAGSSLGDGRVEPVANSLTVDYAGELVTLTPPQSLSFGRRATLRMDDNEFLSRVAGRFTFRQGLWWLQNLSRGDMLVSDADRRSSSVLGPKSQFVLTPSRAVVSFTAGPTRYELWVDRTTALPELPDLLVSGTQTRDFGRVPLTAEQHLLLVVLCARRLETGEAAMPPSRQLAHRLGWSITKFNRKLDGLCMKLAREGVRGLHEREGGRASDRRVALADHAIATGLVQDDDLELLYP